MLKCRNEDTNKHTHTHNMGQLISRAFKRLTQSRNQLQEQSQQEKNESREQQPTAAITIAESIPVGQSIDSAEYRALETNNNSGDSDGTTGSEQQQQQQQVEQNAANENVDDDEENKQGVEEAVIKIQALVRGHLTRKALKDANQSSQQPLQLNGFGPTHSLGQSQFDAESLTQNPPSALFLPSSPVFNSLNQATETNSTSIRSSPTSEQQHQATRTPLESIAELADETTTTTQLDNNQQDRLDSLCKSRRSPSKEEELRPRGSQVSSPALSEAQASIELNCPTPVSVSIDIADLQPSANRIASVLHHDNQNSNKPAQQAEQQQQQQQQAVQPASAPIVLPSGAPDCLFEEFNEADDQEEAAAIRIQSAFRGYRTRKNSPYRTRSLPTATNNNNSTNSPPSANTLKAPRNSKVLCGGHSNEAALIEGDEVGEGEDAEVDLVAGADRRSSRSRHREPSTERVSNGKIDDNTTSPESAQQLSASPEEQEATTTNNQVSVEDTLDESGLSAALEETANLNSSSDLPAAPPAAVNLASRGSVGTQLTSDGSNSLELDTTDNSALDAAIVGLLGEDPASQVVSTSGAQVAALEEDADESSSLAAAAHATDLQLESEARKLIEELDAADDENEPETEAKVDTAVSRLECALEEASSQLGAALDEEEVELCGNRGIEQQQQLATELESDDIERRDPRGQASEQRKSQAQVIPQPATDSSGQSSPVLNLSTGNSSSQNNDDDEEDDEDSEANDGDDDDRQQQSVSPAAAATTTTTTTPAAAAATARGQLPKQKQSTAKSNANKKRNRANKKRANKK